MLRKVARWIDARLHVSALYASTAGHTVPASAASFLKNGSAPAPDIGDLRPAERGEVAPYVA